MDLTLESLLTSSPYCFEDIEEHIAHQKEIIANCKKSSFDEFNLELIAPHYAKGDTKKPAILFLHGLLDSTAIMHSLSQHFESQNFTVLNFLLPGHGTAPKDLLTIHYQDWLSASACAVHALKKQHQSIIVIGLSTGAILGCHLASIGVQIDALITFAPAFTLNLPQRVALKVHQLTSKFGLIKTPWLMSQKESSPYKYASIAANAVANLTQLNTLTKEKLSQAPLMLPILNIVTEDDETISTASALNYLPIQYNPKSRLIYFTSKENTNHSQVFYFNSRIETKNITNFSHICLTVAPNHPIFGESSINKTHKKGAITWLNQLFGNTKRLTYNPHFDKMTTHIDAFIKTIGGSS